MAHEESSSSANDNVVSIIQRVRPHHIFGAGVVVFCDTGRYQVLRRDSDLRELRAGKEVSTALLLKMQNDAAPLFAEETAYDLLRRRDHSAAELRRKLLQKGWNSDLVDPLLETLLKAGYLNDSRYAEQRIHSRLRSRGRSLNDLEADLIRHGVAVATAAEALENYERDHPECFEEALARAIASMPDRNRLTPEQLTARLVRRGFSIQQIVKSFS